MTENKFLISAREVNALAFSTPDSTGNNASVAVPETTLLSAQEKFIRPVVGALYERLERRELPELLENYIKPALALYVKLLLLPGLAVSAGRTGLVYNYGNHLKPADEEASRALARRTRTDAETLMRRAIAHIEAHPDRYPEYRPAENVLNRLSLRSQMLL